MANLASLIREAERIRNSVRVVGPEPDAEPEALRAASPFEMDPPQPTPPVSQPPDAAQEAADSAIRLTEDQMEVLRRSVAPPPEVMTLDEAARYLRLGRSSVVEMVHNEGLPAIKLAGTWRFKRSTLDHWIEIRLAHMPRSLRH